MNNRINKNAVVQGFFGNIILAIIFLVVGGYYILPGFSEVSAVKTEAYNHAIEYKDLKVKGISYTEFQTLHKTLGEKEGIAKNTYLSNVLKELNKEDYETYFSNEAGGSYDTFLDKKLREISDKKLQLENAGLNDVTKNILPYYSDDSSISENSFTDFKFINYIEALLDRFRLQSSDTIGIGKLLIVNSFEEAGKKGENIDKQLEGEIYSFIQKLSLTGKKKDVVNFIYYLENVGKVNVVDSKVKVHQYEPSSTYIDEIGNEKKNDFLDIKRYFRSNEEIFNNLVIDIKSLSFKEYLDSSDLPTDDSDTFFSLIKGEQGSEELKVDIELKFYIQGLPTYEIEEFVSKTHTRYLRLHDITKNGMQLISKKKASFTSSKSLAIINNMKKFSRYLSGIETNMTKMKKSLIKKENMGTYYKQAITYDGIFDIISTQLSIDIKMLSEEMYTKYESILGNKK